MAEYPVYVNETEVGTATIPIPAFVIPPEVWYTIGGVTIIFIVGVLIWYVIGRRR